MRPEGHAARRCSSSVVEHSLGKGEVESSILSCSTIHPLDVIEGPCNQTEIPFCCYKQRYKMGVWDGRQGPLPAGAKRLLLRTPGSSRSASTLPRQQDRVPRAARSRPSRGIYVTTKKNVGMGAGAEKRWATVFKHLRKFLGHDDSRRLTKQDLMSWRNELIKVLAAKTVSAIYLASVRTILN